MGYVRKTRDEYNIEQFLEGYGRFHSWETVCTEDTLTEAKKRVKEYRENQPEYPVRIVKKRTH